MNPDDSNLKKGLRNGDKEVFKHLFMLYSPGLIRYGSSLIHDTETARELVQDLFLELWDKRESLHIQGSIKPYLFSSMYHKGLNWLRAQKIREIYINNPIKIWNWFAYPSSPDRLDPLMLEIIEKQIRLLPGQCREVFTRSAILGEKHGEIAGHLGLSIKTIENHLARARKILRGKLKKIL
ncbi:MAG: sigma-70 family RNA polymerase sigma factor [Porphyromonadaceae bacterium]|nr:MAG: sigma-70 family RNA polymerase sigma factor [Porphyromonadaceae bacterium]